MAAESGMRQAAALTLLAAVFAVGLTYAAVEVPRVAAAALTDAFELPGFDPDDPYGLDSVMRAPAIRLVGYGSLITVLVLMVAGLVAEKRGLASAGAVLFFLPVFGHFAAGMLFLAGLAAARVVWVPFLEISQNVLRLGEIAFVPWILAVYPPALLGIDVREVLVWLLMGSGMFVFFLGTLAWLQARFEGRGTADIRIYRFSRHPQYLGWIVWSYGLMIYLMLHSQLGMTRVNYGIASSLPWMISTLVIIGVAMLEEVRMRRERGVEYDDYARRAPFLLPLPRFVSDAIAKPMRWVLGKPWPESGREVAIVVGVYGAIAIALSAPFVIFNWPPGAHLAGSHAGWWTFPYNVWPFN